MLIRYLLKKWPLLLIYMAAVVAAPIVNVRAAIISGTMLDHASNGEYQLFVNTLLIFLVFFVIHGVLLFLIQTIRAKLVSICRRDLRQDMFRQVMSANNAFFDKPDPGFHIAAFSNDITILESHYFMAWLELIDGILAIAAVIAGIVTLHSQMAFIIIVGHFVSLLVCFIARNYSVKKNKIYIEKLALFTQRIKDYF